MSLPVDHFAERVHKRPATVWRGFNILCQPAMERYDHPAGQRSGSIAVIASDSSSALGASSARMPATYRRIAA